jgi:hypothetical protein
MICPGLGRSEKGADLFAVSQALGPHETDPYCNPSTAPPPLTATPAGFEFGDWLLSVFPTFKSEGDPKSDLRFVELFIPFGVRPGPLGVNPSNLSNSA